MSGVGAHVPRGARSRPGPRPRITPGLAELERLVVDAYWRAFDEASRDLLLYGVYEHRVVPPGPDDPVGLPAYTLTVAPASRREPSWVRGPRIMYGPPVDDDAPPDPPFYQFGPVVLTT